MTQTGGERRSGEDTRNEIRRIALKLFTERGFEGTSIKDIADALGTTKSALYYHFPNKEAIIASLLTDRQADFEELRAWVEGQPRTADLLERTAMRWLDAVTDEKIDGMRFAMANGPAMKRLGSQGGSRRSGIDALLDLILPADAPLEARLHARLVFETLPALISAARDTDATTRQLIDVARRAVHALITAGPPADPTP
ncbi:helix-turn-helix domain-containing protein [Microbispora amethystogenes]|uniref:TetR/AcrR family transcriptional regulator n=1 Tax=Microbispora amethystogenes TaxID=1427754 RepID=UPI0033C45898